MLSINVFSNIYFAYLLIEMSNCSFTFTGSFIGRL